MSLNFKAYKFTTKEAEGNTLIFDIIRKKYVVLSPEEWVRQNVIRYLTEDKGVPEGLVTVERSLEFNQLRKRFDVCVAERSGKLKLLVECKAPHVPLSTQTLMQIAVYQKVLEVSYLMLTNGRQHLFFFAENNEKPKQLMELPHFEEWI